jgi:tRNA (guanine37-N1)-methyltransferase
MSDPAAPRLHFEILTLFPELFDSFLAASLLGKAIEGDLIRVDRTNPRDFAPGKHKSVDDGPYGGGVGMVLRPQPLAAAIDHVEAARGPCHRILLSPQGRLFDQQKAAALLAHPRILLICGRYEGVDERIPALYAHDVLSIGDYVLSGGEIAAAVVIEATSRLLPGVLGKNESTVDESFTAGRLEYPQYTRPPEFRGLPVPEILLSGDHGAIERWRRRESIRRTIERRPDLLEARPLSDDERRLLGAELSGGASMAPAGAQGRLRAGHEPGHEGLQSDPPTGKSPGTPTPGVDSGSSSA